MRAVEKRQITADACSRLIAALRKCGVHELGKLAVTFPRARRIDQVARYLPRSQYRGKTKIQLDVDTARERVVGREGANLLSIRIEVYRALAHAYASALLEAANAFPSQAVKLDLPDWRTAYNGDPARFTDDFADFMNGGLFCNSEFWLRFLPAYETIRSAPASHAEHTSTTQISFNATFQW